MEKTELKELVLEIVNEVVDRKVREHEIRVGWISGIIGVFFIFGIIHSIWLIKSWIM